MVDLLKIPRVVDCFFYLIINLLFYDMLRLPLLLPKMSCALPSSVKTKLSSLLVDCYISFMLSSK